MIDWIEVEKDLRDLAHNTRYELGTTGYHAERILNYIKDLISKEFKLVASGEIEVRNYDNLEEVFDRFFRENSIEDYGKIFERVEKYNGKNISIYMGEDEVKK
jgi:hypothetical protein